jgi:hypothetical protein
MGSTELFCSATPPASGTPTVKAAPPDDNANRSIAPIAVSPILPAPAPSQTVDKKKETQPSDEQKPPEAPKNFSAKVKDNKVYLSWKGKADFFAIERNHEAVKTLTGDSTTWIDNDKELTDGEGYCYSVVAFKDKRNSEPAVKCLLFKKTVVTSPGDKAEQPNTSIQHNGYPDSGNNSYPDSGN